MAAAKFDRIYFLISVAPPPHCKTPEILLRKWILDGLFLVFPEFFKGAVASAVAIKPFSSAVGGQADAKRTIDNFYNIQISNILGRFGQFVAAGYSLEWLKHSSAGQIFQDFGQKFAGDSFGLLDGIDRTQFFFGQSGQVPDRPKCIIGFAR